MTTSTEAPETLAPEDDEISLYDIWQILLEGWRWIAGGTVAGVIAAVGYLALTPPQYEAIALVQVGQVGQVGQSGQSGQAPIEPATRVIERIMFPTFKTAMVKKLGWDGGDTRGAVYASTLKASITKGGDLVELRVQGLTPEEAASSLSATIEYLAFLHKTMAQPVMESLQAELKEVTAEATKTGKVLAELERTGQLQRQIAPRDRFSESILYEQLSAASESRLRELRRKEAQYREWFSPTGKAVTVAFTEPSAPDAPVSPKKRQTLMLATLGGFFLGVVAVMLRRGWRNRRSARTQLADG